MFVVFYLDNPDTPQPIAYDSHREALMAWRAVEEHLLDERFGGELPRYWRALDEDIAAVRRAIANIEKSAELGVLYAFYG